MLSRCVDWNAWSRIESTLTARKDNSTRFVGILAEVVKAKVATPYSRGQADIRNKSVRLLRRAIGKLFRWRKPVDSVAYTLSYRQR